MSITEWPTERPVHQFMTPKQDWMSGERLRTEYGKVPWYGILEAQMNIKYVIETYKYVLSNAYTLNMSSKH